jgi:hypothetical protein
MTEYNPIIVAQGMDVNLHDCRGMLVVAWQGGHHAIFSKILEELVCAAESGQTDQAW